MSDEWENPRLPKGLLVDNLGHCALTLSAIAYFALFLGAVIAGAMGPPIFSTASNPAARLSQSCADPNSCQVTWFGTLTDMSPQHQFMWLNMNMQRPKVDPGSGAGLTPALLGVPVTWNIVYQVDIMAVALDGTRVAMVVNQTHLQTISFDAQGSQSSDVLLFYTQVGWEGCTQHASTRAAHQNGPGMLPCMRPSPPPPVTSPA